MTRLTKRINCPEFQWIQPTCICYIQVFIQYETFMLCTCFRSCIFFQALQINWDRCSRLLCTSKWRELARKSRYASQKKHVEFGHVGQKLTHPCSACPLPSLLLRHSTSLSLSFSAPSVIPLILLLLLLSVSRSFFYCYCNFLSVSNEA